VAADVFVVDGGDTHAVLVTLHVEYEIAAEALVEAAALMLIEQGLPVTTDESPRAAHDRYSSVSYPLGTGWTALTL
jgi:hypothetical protein